MKKLLGSFSFFNYSFMWNPKKSHCRSLSLGLYDVTIFEVTQIGDSFKVDN